MSKLRERLFEHYDEHYRRGNALDGPVDQAFFDRCVSGYEACFGSLVSLVPEGSAVADIGCGMGLLLYWLHKTYRSRFRLFGVDISGSQLAAAKSQLKESVSLVEGEAASFLKAHPKGFHVVFCTDLLEHIESEDEMLELVESARDALVPGGTFVCRVPNMANLISSQLRYIDLTHRRGFTSLSLLQLLEAAGLSQSAILMPKAEDVGQWVRMAAERIVHRVIYRVCGVGNERHFSRMLMGVGKA